VGLVLARVSIFALALTPTAAQAGAWTQAEGHGQVLVTATGSQADQSFDASGNTQSRPRYSKAELQALLEYGVTDWLTAILLPGLQRVDIAGPVEARRTGLGYTEFGGQARLLQGDLSGNAWVFSVQTTARVPGTFDTGNPAAIGYTGVEIDLRGLLGISFDAGGWPAFVDLQLGQRFRTGGPPNETRVDLTFGLRTAPQWLLLAQSFNVIAQGSGDPPFTNTNYYKLQFSVLYDLTPQWTLQAGLFTTIAGRNALQENGMLFGAGYKF
jgi:hypothetical protein